MKFNVLKLCRRHPIITTAVYSLSPAIILMGFVRFPDVDIMTVEGWRSLLTPENIAQIVIATVIWTWSILRFIRFLVAYRRMQNTDNEFDNSYMALLIGAPGTGKTASGTQISFAAAERSWRTLQFERAKLFGKLDHLREVIESDTATDEEKEDARFEIAYYEFVDKSYQFFKSNEDKYIPCFLSSNPVWDLDGRMSYRYESKYVTEHTLLPAFSVVFCDEIGYEEGCDRSRELPPDFATWYRYHRQFGDYKIYGTDQDSGAVCIQARRCTDNNRALYRQKWVLRPGLLLWISDKLKDRANSLQSNLRDLRDEAREDLGAKSYNLTPFHEAVLSDDVKKQIDFSAFYNAVEDYRSEYDKKHDRFMLIIRIVVGIDAFARCIGFRDISYFDEGNTERSLNPFRGRGHLVFPSCPNCYYDDHASLTLNPALFDDVDKLTVSDVSIEGWKTRRYSPTDRPLPTSKKLKE